MSLEATWILFVLAILLEIASVIINVCNKNNNKQLQVTAQVIVIIALILLFMSLAQAQFNNTKLLS